MNSSTRLLRVTVPLRRSCLSHSTIQQIRSYASQPESLIQETDIPAPHTGAIKILTLNRPKARNAISKALLAELRQHIDSLHAQGETGETRALVIASAVDNVFCAGADLKERKSMSTEEVNTFLATLRSTFAQINALPIPTISAVHGTALGGGLELALTTTFRVFASSATVGLPETRLGIIPGAGGTHRLPTLIGLNHARDLTLTGRRVKGEEALALGLCNRLVEDSQLMPTEPSEAKDLVLQGAVTLASEICEGGPIAVRQALMAVNGFAGGQEVENKAYERLLSTEDRLEALKAFAEKRKPEFKGR